MNVQKVGAGTKGRAMNTTELIEIARECAEEYSVYGITNAFIFIKFDDAGLHEFIQRIEQPHLQRIAELTQRAEKVADSLEQAEKRLTEIAFKACANLDTKDAQIAQLREALQGFLDAFNGGYEPSLQTVFIASKALEETK